MNWLSLEKLAEETVAQTLQDLPEPVRQHLEGVPILIEKVPGTEDRERGVEPDTLGYFDEDEAGLVRIRLWLDNIFSYSEEDPDVFQEEVRLTLLHEIGHVLGWDEEEIAERGLE